MNQPAQPTASFRHPSFIFMLATAALCSLINIALDCWAHDSTSTAYSDEFIIIGAQQLWTAFSITAATRVALGPISFRILTILFIGSFMSQAISLALCYLLNQYTKAFLDPFVQSLVPNLIGFLPTFLFYAISWSFIGLTVRLTLFRRCPLAVIGLAIVSGILVGVMEYLSYWVYFAMYWYWNVLELDYWIPPIVIFASHSFLKLFVPLTIICSLLYDHAPVIVPGNIPQTVHRKTTHYIRLARNSVWDFVTVSFQRNRHFKILVAIIPITISYGLAELAITRSLNLWLKLSLVTILFAIMLVTCTYLALYTLTRRQLYTLFFGTLLAPILTALILAAIALIIDTGKPVPLTATNRILTSVIMSASLWTMISLVIYQTFRPHLPRSIIPSVLVTSILFSSLVTLLTPAEFIHWLTDSERRNVFFAIFCLPTLTLTLLLHYHRHTSGTLPCPNQHRPQSQR